MRRPDVLRGGPKPSEAQWRIGASTRRIYDGQGLASSTAGSIGPEEIAQAPTADVVPIDTEGRRIVLSVAPGAETAEVPVSLGDEPLGTDAYCLEASLRAVETQLGRTARELESEVPVLNGKVRRRRLVSLEGLADGEIVADMDEEGLFDYGITARDLRE